jgi:hypothetical protein
VRRQDQQVAAAAIVEDGRWLVERQDQLRARLAPVFCQARSRLAAFAYVGALLAAPGGAVLAAAEQAGQATPRRMQALAGRLGLEGGAGRCSGSSWATWPIRGLSWCWMRPPSSSRDG